MLFNSLSFAIFLPIIFLLYWRIKNIKIQNLFLLAASYFFYGWWDYRYLSLVLLCSITHYVAGIILQYIDKKYITGKGNWRRKTVLCISCLISLGVLGVFKYYDFFVTSFVEIFANIGISLNATTLHLILPVGISFYTFHTLSYTIDVYRRKFQPTKDIISFFLFVSIFPLAMAGPIERATNLLPQIYKNRTFDYDLAVDGMRQILWGLFKKLVIADNCAFIVNQVFDNYTDVSSSTLALGAIFFSFQIYGDFSGYSDMALGIGKLLGFRFLRNFSMPYFSRDIAEFWRRWHISLTTWFRDYLYIPLGGSRGSKFKTIRNTFIIFLVSGFWHGANWTFIIWGFYHALLFMPLLLVGKNRNNVNSIVAKDRKLPTIKEVMSIMLTFALVTVGWIIFRAENIHAGFVYIQKIFSYTILSIPEIYGFKVIFYLLVATPIFIFFEWTNRQEDFGLSKICKNKTLRWSIYVILTLMIIEMGGYQQKFIYFQF
jgi:D-alanyl-lipoteichoic acid acyltransferase DltB (MBOAT superfamily)